VHVAALRLRAIAALANGPAPLELAVERLGFVQADPIRAPAPAQDLILRQRVHDYRAGDLERAYPQLALEEGYLYAYGFLPRALRQLLPPRPARPLGKLERDVLAAVRGPTHPRDLEAAFGRKRVVNAWGGFSKATTRALEALCGRGLLRVARRENGVRVFAPAHPHDPAPPAERLRELAKLIARILAPVDERTLRARLVRFRALGNPRATVAALVQSGELVRETVDGVAYLWSSDAAIVEEAPTTVRLLAPFDPLVWDRRRFEHLWGWPYRFEAYTTAAERVRGYYALPLLWRDRVIGWANATVDNSRLDVALGFVRTRPRDREFRRELDAELARFAGFLAGED
jgi:uncharacterized protein YcaQ